MALLTFPLELQRQMEYEKRWREDERYYMMSMYETSIPSPPVVVDPSKPKSNKKLLLCK